MATVVFPQPLLVPAMTILGILIKLYSKVIVKTENKIKAAQSGQSSFLDGIDWICRIKIFINPVNPVNPVL
jgi:hypothetical protein